MKFRILSHNQMKRSYLSRYPPLNLRIIQEGGGLIRHGFCLHHVYINVGFPMHCGIEPATLQSRRRGFAMRPKRPLTRTLIDNAIWTSGYRDVYTGLRIALRQSY
ncbi:hypothetical protein AVEN_185066-1 [Araneus ventricosus]|uniref:Uncharacterized protein n=1 Tax=Araneus ventricosus TaxID=182803 RepID=A0A4Y2BSF9_ARAVE|nr:hypothetical protein AVEN_185066-1 [Araneus ventricosus]